MNISLSDDDLKRINPQLHILVYSDLKNYNPNQLLRMMPLAILYQQTDNTGHWVLLHQTKNGIEFFDPYGYKPDTEFEFLHIKQPHYIAKLLYRLDLLGHKINYNQYQFQQSRSGVNTCGRHVLLRSKYPNRSIDEYKSMLDKITNLKGLHEPYDNIVVNLIN